MKFYFVSESSELKVLHPRIPENFLTKNGYEENTIKRVCVSSSISGCLTGLSRNIKNNILYVYEIETENFVKPNINLVPDVLVTGEHWIMNSITLKLAKKILVKETYDSLFFELNIKNKISKIETFSWSYEVIEDIGSKELSIAL